MKNETNELNLAILALEKKRAFELDLLKDQLHTSYESLKLINIIKNTLDDFSSSPEIKNDIITNAISIGSGFLAKKIVIGNSEEPTRNLLGNVVQYAVTNVASNYAEEIKITAEHLLYFYLKNRKDSKNKLTA